MRDTVQVPDTQVDPGFAQRGTGAWHRSVLAVPLLHAGLPIGAIGLGRATPGTFSTAQVELLKIFAEQAVIAIGSAETFRALQTRTSDLQETLEYQTATSDVLNVISRSTFDLKPVLARVAEITARLCVADRAAIFSYEGGMVRLAANFGFPPDTRLISTPRGWFRLLIRTRPESWQGPPVNVGPCMFTMRPPFQDIPKQPSNWATFGRHLGYPCCAKTNLSV